MSIAFLWMQTCVSLPPQYVRVLVMVQCYPHENAHTIGWHCQGRWELDGEYGDAESPSHWMPLPPEPPEWRYATIASDRRNETL